MGKNLGVVDCTDTTGERCVVNSGIALDSGTVADAFTITGGPAMATCMIMEITESPNSACNMAWEADPTAGSNNVPIGTALDINGFDVGDFVYAEGDGTALMHADVDAGTKLPRAIGTSLTGAHNGIVIPVGGIDIVMSNSNPTDGIGTMFIRYLPLSPECLII